MTKPSISLPADLEHGTLKVDRERLTRLLAKLPDGPYEVTIAKQVRRRSRKANAYLWGCVYKLLSEHTGYTPDELHAHFKQQFLGVQTKQILLQDEAGEVKHQSTIEVDPTTTIMDTHEFTIFIEQVRQVAAELGCVTPDPDPEWMFNRKDAAETKQSTRSVRNGTSV